jgi:hypothetical protein
MKKLSAFFCCAWVTLSGYGSSLDSCEEAFKAFKAFEPEATSIIVSYSTVNPVGDEIRTLNYTPETPNLLRYLCAYKELKNEIYATAIAKGIVVGLLTAGADLMLGSKEIVSKIGFIFCSFTPIASILYENHIVNKKVPYFDEYLTRKDNLFDSTNSITFGRMGAALGVSYTTYVLCGLIGEIARQITST